MGRDQGSRAQANSLTSLRWGRAAPHHAEPADAVRLNSSVTLSDLPDIHVAAVALIRERRVLMVTARERDVFYMPGGKIDKGESVADAAAREAHEEVSISLSPADLTELFVVTTQAHGEPEGRLVRMHVFGVDAAVAASVTPTPSAEVSALHWVTAADADRCPPAGAEVLQRLHALALID